MTFYWRGGGAPVGGRIPSQCIAVCLKAQIQMKDCTPRAAKEYDHYMSPDSYAWNDTVSPQFDLKSELGGSMVGKLIGQKVVMYDVTDATGKPTAVKIVYVDTGSINLAAPDPSKQNWRLLAAYTDDGSSWPAPSQETYVEACNAKKGQAFLGVAATSPFGWIATCGTSTSCPFGPFSPEGSSKGPALARPREHRRWLRAKQARSHSFILAW